MGFHIFVAVVAGLAWYYGGAIGQALVVAGIVLLVGGLDHGLNKHHERSFDDIQAIAKKIDRRLGL
jgi:hypothetical protein